MPPTLCRQALDVDPFGCQETEAGVDVLDLDGQTDRQTAIRLCASVSFDLHFCTLHVFPTTASPTNHISPLKDPDLSPTQEKALQTANKSHFHNNNHNSRSHGYIISIKLISNWVDVD